MGFLPFSPKATPKLNVRLTVWTRGEKGEWLSVGVWVNELSDFDRISMKFSVCARKCVNEGVSVWIGNNLSLSGRGNFGV